MTAEICFEADTRYAVGPQRDVYDHGPVTVIGDPDSDRDGPVWICLDCGYLSADIRRFLHAECGRTHNTIGATWRESIAEHGFPGQE